MYCKQLERKFVRLGTPEREMLLICGLETGSAPCVGSLGATLGAGIGPLQGHRGLMLDALESVRLVTANGSLITVSNTSYPDLFWGIRGAGFNFGIIPEATYKVYDTTYNGQVMNGDLLFPASANRSIWEIFKSYDDTLPAKLSLVAAMSYNATLNDVSFSLGYSKAVCSLAMVSIVGHCSKRYLLWPAGRSDAILTTFF